MIQQPTINEEFRDAALRMAYPFTEGSTLEQGTLTIGEGVFLDAAFFFTGSISLPIRLKRLSGMEKGVLVFSFDDGSGNPIGSLRINPGSGVDLAPVLSIDGRHIGDILFSLPGLKRLQGRAFGQLFEFDLEVAEFVAEVTQISQCRNGYIGLRLQGSFRTGNVVIEASTGLAFVMSGGELSLAVLGGMPTTSGASNAAHKHLKTLNGVGLENPVIATLPQCNIRVDTDKGAITVRTVTDCGD